MLAGRWNAVTRSQEAALAHAAASLTAEFSEILLVVTAASETPSRRNPLADHERAELARSLGLHLARALPRPVSLRVELLADTPSAPPPHQREDPAWVERLAALSCPAHTLLIGGNPEVLAAAAAQGFHTRPIPEEGVSSLELVRRCALGEPFASELTAPTLACWEAWGVPARIRELFGTVSLQSSGELTEHRDFHTYAQGMDAGLKLKCADLLPWVLPGRVVDAGCGTGALMQALAQRCPECTLVGVDLSPEILRIAERKHYAAPVEFLRASITLPVLPEASVDTIILSSILHEVYSYTGYDRDSVRTTLRAAHHQLRPGGRICIRDGVDPEGSDQRVWLEMDPETALRFERFAREFRPAHPSPGVVFTPHPSTPAAAPPQLVALSLHDANEFISKKDYLENWECEVQEEFGVFTCAQWAGELEEAGFGLLEARSYLNDWIRVNRYEGRVALRADAGGEPGVPLPYPDSTVVLVAEAH